MPTIHRRIRDPRIRLVRGEVGQRRSDAGGVILKQADSGIAPGTEKAANRASLMIMIYGQALLYACVGLGYAKSLAYRAAAILSFQQGVVFGWLNTQLLAPASVRAKSVVFLPVFLAPLRLLIACAWLAKALKAIDLTACLKELGFVLHGFTGAAPLHSFRRFWPARREAIVAVQVTHGLALDPSPVRSVPGCNRRWSAAAALANAFRYFGHHAFPSHLVLPTISKVKSNG